MKNKLNYFTSGIYFVNLIQNLYFQEENVFKSICDLYCFDKNAIQVIASNWEEAINSKKAYDVFQYKLDHNKTDHPF